MGNFPLKPSSMGVVEPYSMDNHIIIINGSGLLVLQSRVKVFDSNMIVTLTYFGIPIQAQFKWNLAEKITFLTC